MGGGGILLQEEGTAATPLVSAGLKGDTGSARRSDESTAGKRGWGCANKGNLTAFSGPGSHRRRKPKQMTDFKDTLSLLLNMLCLGDRSYWVK